VAEGTHDELLRTSLDYRRLAELQFAETATAAAEDASSASSWAGLTGEGVRGVVA
jgi:hypothetical protein